MSQIVGLVVAAALLGQSQPSSPKPLRWGSTPPALKVGQWVTHRPRAVPGPQKEGEEQVFVVHFWAMRDDASRHLIPHLVQLQRDYAERSVTVIAVSNEDGDELASYCSQPAELPYAVAADAENQTTEAWLAEVSDFPWTFVLDKGGRIIWSGNSTWTLREVVAAAVKGTYDLAAARKKVDAGKKIATLTEAMNDAMQNGDREAVLRIAGRIIDADPTRPESYAMKRSLLRRLRRPEKVAELNEAMRRAMWDSAAGLAEMLEAQWAETELEQRDPALMRRCAERLAALTERKDPFALAMLARVQHELGFLDEAIVTQARAEELIRWDPEKEFAGTAEYYRRVKSAARGTAVKRQAASRPASRPQRALEPA